MLAVNLLPWRTQRWQRRRQLSLVLLTSVLAVVLLSLCLLWWQGERLRQQHVRALEAMSLMLADMQSQLSRQQMLLQQRDALIAAQQAQARDQAIHQRWQQFWLQLPELMPATLWLSRIERRQEQLLLEGAAQTMAAVGDFRRQLLAQPLLAAVKQSSVQRQANGDYRFALRARMQESPDE